MPPLPRAAPAVQSISASRTGVDEILLFREMHRQEMNCQIVHDSFPQRGLSDPYVVRANGQAIGYGLVANKHYPETVNEFYVVPPCRRAVLPMFRQFLEVSGAAHIRAQTNDRLLLRLLYDCAEHITADNVLFADTPTTSLPCSGGTLRQAGGRGPEEWAIESDDQVVASGGLLFHYNPPYGDIFMNVEEPYRQRGFGSYLVQELKRICYELGKIPAARCNADNTASRKTLQKAGMLPSGRILQGAVTRDTRREDRHGTAARLG